MNKKQFWISISNTNFLYRLYHAITKEQRAEIKKILFNN